MLRDKRLIGQDIGDAFLAHFYDLSHVDPKELQGLIFVRWVVHACRQKELVFHPFIFRCVDQGGYQLEPEVKIDVLKCEANHIRHDILNDSLWTVRVLIQVIFVNIDDCEETLQLSWVTLLGSLIMTEEQELIVVWLGGLGID